VLGLGPNLFYNSPMEACIVICRTSKSPERRGKVLLINAVDEVTREHSMSFLKLEHQERIAAAYNAFTCKPPFAYVAMVEEIATQEFNLSIPLYVQGRSTGGTQNEYATADKLRGAVQVWEDCSINLKIKINTLFTSLDLKL